MTTSRLAGVWKVGNLDGRLLGVVFAILVVGVLSIYSVTDTETSRSTPLYVKQFVWICAGAVAFLLMLLIDYHKLARYAGPIYVLALVLLLIVLVAGKASRGSQRWISLGLFAVQPSEFAKLALILVLASYYAHRPREGWVRRVLVPGLITLPGFLLILKQPDLGSSLSFVAIYVSVVLVIGIRRQALGLGVLFGLMLFPFAWGGMWESLHDYQRERLLTFIDPTYDLEGKGYHGLQSRIAVGSGELLGKGLQGGTQTQFKFLPEGHTDFVFAVFAEEWGFVGAMLLLLLFLALILLGVDIAMKARDLLGSLIAVGVVAMIGFCIVVNIGMTLGLFPIVGIPLPLMSYGGSITVTTLTALGLLMNVKKRRSALAF